MPPRMSGRARQKGEISVRGELSKSITRQLCQRRFMALLFSAIRYSRPFSVQPGTNVALGGLDGLVCNQ